MWKAFTRLFRVPSQQNDEADTALLVSFMAERGECDVLRIRTGMEDHTRGEQDWTFANERRLYRLLDRLEAEGTVTSRVDSVYGRVYTLRAPKERLLKAV